MNKNISVLVIGDIMLDHYIYGACNRISPEAPVPVVEINQEKYTLGGAGNVLRNLVAFNCQVEIISVTGADDNAATVVEQLSDIGINSRGLIQDPSRCTTIKSRVMVSNHQLMRLDREDVKPISEQIAEKLINAIKVNITDYDIVLLSDYNKGLFTDNLLKQIFIICKAAGIKTILDPKFADFGKYKGVNIIKPNKKEAIMATGILIKDRETLHAACVKIKQQTECDDVIITLSEDGVALYTDNQLTLIPTKAMAVVDVTGAGDTVLASLGLALANGDSLQVACDFANHAAAVVVNKIGSATATMEEINKKFNN